SVPTSPAHSNRAAAISAGPPREKHQPPSGGPYTIAPHSRNTPDALQQAKIAGVIPQFGGTWASGSGSSRAGRGRPRDIRLADPRARAPLPRDYGRGSRPEPLPSGPRRQHHRQAAVQEPPFSRGA